MICFVRAAPVVLACWVGVIGLEAHGRSLRGTKKFAQKIN